MFSPEPPDVHPGHQPKTPEFQPPASPITPDVVKVDVPPADPNAEVLELASLPALSAMQIPTSKTLDGVGAYLKTEFPLSAPPQQALSPPALER